MSGSSPRFGTVATSVCSSNDTVLFNHDQHSSRINEDCFASTGSKEDSQRSEFKSPLLFETPLDLLCNKLRVQQFSAQKGNVCKKFQDKDLASFGDIEITQARHSSLCSSQTSKNHSPLLGPVSLSNSSKIEPKPLNSLQHLPEVSLFDQFDKLKMDRRIQAKTWMQLVIRAIEEDLAKSAIKCANKFCTRVQQPSIEVESKKRKMGECKEWLCDTCVKAYDQRQFCEFCSQIYLDTKNEAALDGKEWAQCEALKRCGRWAHVDCLAKKFGTTREVVVSDNFEYKCCGCQSKTGRKRTM
jgi:hypothetical protein